MKERLQRIKNKLAAARQRKIACFGSGLKNHNGRQVSGHKWESYPVPEEKIAEFEVQHNITLPEEYRAFIKEIGIGAGPYYGLHDLYDDLAAWMCDEKTAEGFLSSPCLLTPEMCEDRKDLDWYDNTIEKIGVHEDRVYQGILSIVSQGCTYLSGLVVTGEHRGQILDLDVSGLVPFWRNSSFLDWYEGWLDRVIKADEQPKPKPDPKPKTIIDRVKELFKRD